MRCTDGWVSSSATEVVVSWEQPERPNGIITGYYLELHEYQVTGAAIASREITDNSTSTTFTGLALGEHIVLAKPLCQHLAWWDGCTVYLDNYTVHVQLNFFYNYMYIHDDIGGFESIFSA